MEQDRRNRDSDFFMQDDYYYDEATGSFKKRTDAKRPGSSAREASGKKHGTAAFLSLLTALIGVCAAASPLGLLLDICAILLAVYALVRRQHKATAAAGILISAFSDGRHSHRKCSRRRDVPAV